MSAITQSLRPSLERVRRAWRASPAPAFLAWWLGELRGLLPARWQALVGSGECWCLLRHADGEWILRRSGQSAPLGRWSDALDAAAQQASLAAAVAGIDRQDLRLALCLPPAAVLRRPLSLPLAARDSLRQVGAYEMDRQTPFRVEQVYYAIRETAGAAPPGRFMAELVAVPRAALDAPWQRLRETGIAVDAVDLAEGDGRLGVDLLPPERMPPRRDPRKRLNLALAGGLVLLALLCLGQWLHNREQALAAMQAEVDSLRGQARQVAELRRQLEDSAGAAGFLARRKADSATVLDVLEDLTERLPDDTWLERFTLDDDGRIGFQGQSAKAAHLVDVLQDSKRITGANFQGVIQRDPGTGKERFYMNAQVRPPAAAGKPAAGRGKTP